MKTKYLLTAFILFGFSFQNLFATNIPAGNVYGHWTQAGSPYLVLGNITVPQDSLLLVDAGVTVEFQGHQQLLVMGRIRALGTSGNLITFTALTNWWGIRYDGISASQDSSVFVYCTFEKGNASGAGNYANGGAFFISGFSKVRIANSVFTNNTAYIFGGAIFCTNANPIIIGNTFTGNTNSVSNAGGFIHCYLASPTIKNNTCTNNSGPISCTGSSPSIIGNSISYGTGTAGVICEYNSSPLIMNNIISHRGMGIYIDDSSPQVIGNVIIYNDAYHGGGIRIRFNSSPLIANNTIANNTASIDGGGLFVDYSSSPVIVNTILWNNYAPQGNELALDQTSTPTFYNCDIKGGSAAFYYYDAPNTFTGTYINNIDSDPLFENPSLNNFSLQATSPCINAGDTTGLTLPLMDLAGNPRICYTNVDIGAYEICGMAIQEHTSDKIRTFFYPNPSHENVTLIISGQGNSQNLKLHFINTLGEITKEILVFSSLTIIPTREMTSGIYYYQINDGENILSTGKLIVE